MSLYEVKGRKTIENHSDFACVRTHIRSVAVDRKGWRSSERRTKNIRRFENRGSGQLKLRCPCRRFHEDLKSQLARQAKEATVQIRTLTDASELVEIHKQQWGVFQTGMGGIPRRVVISF